MKTLFRLSDPAIGLLSSSFTFSYLLAAPLAGFWGMRFEIKKMLGGGIFLFSIGMLISAMAEFRWMLFLGRILTGFGEAVLSTMGPVYVYHLVSSSKGAKLGWFYLAIPLGSAMGFLLGGAFLSTLTIHQILLLPVLPGLLFASIFMLKGRDSSPLSLSSFPFPKDLSFLSDFRNKLSREDKNMVLLSFQIQTLVTFVLGGMAAWITFYFIRVKMFPVATIESLTGGMLLVGGVIGMLGGGKFLDREIRVRPGIPFHGPTLFGLCSALVGVLVVITGNSLLVCGIGLLLSISGIFLVFVPLNWILLSRDSKVSPAVLIGLSLLVSHLLGDLLSPFFIGEVSQRWGLAFAVETTLIIPLILAIVIHVVYVKKWRTCRE
jgi:MFS family permease